MILVDGPYFEDFKIGDTLESPPSITLTEGFAAIHQAIFGDRMRLPLDHSLCKDITGSENVLANPSMVINVAIGQTTYATQHVVGNLFYRGLILKQPVYLGDTLTTTTKVVALRQNSIKPGRASSGMVTLEIQVKNQKGEEILYFWRCPMVACRDAEVITRKADDLTAVSEEIDQNSLIRAIPSQWNLCLFRERIEGAHYSDIDEGTHYQVEARDTVTCAPELARMTLNMAMIHTDEAASAYGQRVVYGGHTITMAAAQMTRALPNIVTLMGWYHCNHLAPVFENDILQSEIFVDKKTPMATGGGLVELTIKVWADRGKGNPGLGSKVQVLDWSLVVLMA